MKRSWYKLFLLPLRPKPILPPTIANTRLSSWPLSAWAREAHRGDVISQGEVLLHQQQRYVVVEVVIVKTGVDLIKIQMHMIVFSSSQFQQFSMSIYCAQTIFQSGVDYNGY
jgi:hypothetical protein